MVLKSLRKAQKGFFAKTLIGLIALSFLMWGFIGIFSHYQHDDTLVSIGKQGITLDAFDKELNKHATQDAISIQDDTISKPDIIKKYFQSGYAQVILKSIIKRTLFDQAATDLAMHAADEQLAQLLSRQPEFQNEHGAFDKKRFVALLQSNGLSQEVYLHALRKFIVHADLLEAATLLSVQPDVLTQILYKVSNQKRSGNYMIFDRKDVPLKEPHYQTLEAYYARVKDEFDIPEKRSFEILTLSLQKLTQAFEAKMTPDKIQKKFLDIRDDIENELSTNTSLTLSELQNKFKTLPFSFHRFNNTHLKEKLPPIPEDIASDAFSQILNNVFRPADDTYPLEINSKKMGDTLYWFRVTTITPPKHRPLAAVKKQVRQKWILKKIYEGEKAMAEKAMTLLAQGLTLEHVAQKMGKTLHATPALGYSDPYHLLFDNRENHEQFFSVERHKPFLIHNTHQATLIVAEVTHIIWPKNTPSRNQVSGIHDYLSNILQRQLESNLAATLSIKYGGIHIHEPLMKKIYDSYNQ